MGRRGERLAARYLRRRGIRILGRNVRTPAGEVDLLCQEGLALVVVEVKATRSARDDLLFQRLDGPQLRRLRSIAAWLRRQRSPRNHYVRCDLVTVRLSGATAGIRHHRDVASP